MVGFWEERRSLKVGVKAFEKRSCVGSNNGDDGEIGKEEIALLF